MKILSKHEHYREEVTVPNQWRIQKLGTGRPGNMKSVWTPLVIPFLNCDIFTKLLEGSCHGFQDLPPVDPQQLNKP